MLNRKKEGDDNMFHKVYFSDGRGNRTAGLVLNEEHVKNKSITELSRLFPYSEANKMQFIYISPGFETWEEAFNHSTDSDFGSFWKKYPHLSWNEAIKKYNIEQKKRGG